MADTAPDDLDHDRVFDAAMHLAAAHGWDQLALRDIARAAGVSLATLYRHYPRKQAVLAGFTRNLDRRILDSVDPEDIGEAARDRLFEVLMQRFDLLQPHKEAVRAILKSYQRDPLLAVGGLCQLRRSMSVVLEAANISASGARGRLRRDGLCGLYLAVLRVWLGDETSDMSRTMAALDTYLRRIEQPVAVLEGLRTGGPQPGGETGTA